MIRFLTDKVEFELRARVLDGSTSTLMTAASLSAPTHPVSLLTLVSVNPYVPKYFGPEKLPHAQFADNFLSIGIYRI